METNYKQRYVVSIIIEECFIDDNNEVLDFSIVEKDATVLNMFDNENEAKGYMEAVDQLIYNAEDVQIQEKEESDRE